jgi:hypothetical protein
VTILVNCPSGFLLILANSRFYKIISLRCLGERPFSQEDNVLGDGEDRLWRLCCGGSTKFCFLKV